MFKLIALILSTITVGCGYYEEPHAVACRTDFLNIILQNSDKCYEFNNHEKIFLEGLELNTKWTKEQAKDLLTGYAVVLKNKSELQYDKNGVAFWTSEDVPNFEIHGRAWCNELMIELADENFGSGILAHEFGHGLMQCGPFDHSNMAYNGINATIQYVQKNYKSLTGASGGSLYGTEIMPDIGCKG